MNEIDKIYHQFLKSKSVSIDSRIVEKGDIFFALKGERFNGNQFALKSIESGAAMAVVDDPGLKDKPGCILVDDSLRTLQSLANRYRKSLKTTIIGITGSNGKTTTKELIAGVLSTQYKTWATQGNLNNHIGVPLTLLRINKDTRFAVVEMGANHPGEIAELSQIAEPDYGIITNIGKAHLEGFGGFEGVIKTKTELYRFIQKRKGVIFYNADNQMLDEKSMGLRRVSFGTGTDVFCRGRILSGFPYLKISVIHNDEQFTIDSKLAGNYNFENILAAVCIGLYFEVDEENVKAAIENYIPANNRSQVIRTDRNLLILDAYNANPTSMEASINHFYQSNYNEKFLILGEMFELGKDSDSEHADLVSRIGKLGFKDVILVGNYFEKFRSGFDWFPSTDELIKFLEAHPISGKTILIKGSRGNALEKIVNYL